MSGMKGQRGMPEADIEQTETSGRRYQKPTFRKALTLVNVTAGGPPPAPIGSAPLTVS